MKIIQKRISKITPYENNPRNNDAAVEPVAASIKEFGFRVPILIDADGVIIAGHTRYKAAILLNMDEVPCIQADDLTPEQIKAFRIADNKTAEYAAWDFDALAAELDALQQIGYDLTLTGFAQDALDDILATLEPAKEAKDDGFEGDIDPEESPYSQPGDIWMLNSHRLMCGDSTCADTVAVLMHGSLADMCLTDPPYNVDYEGKTADKLTIKNDNMPQEQYYEFLLSVHRNIYASIKDGAAVYVFHADSEGETVRRAYRESGLKLAQCCIWAKNTMVMGRQDYQWQHEPVLYGWKPTGAHKWYSDRSQTTIWNFDRPVRSAEHPTMKPIPLMAYPIQNSSPKGGIVLDLFGGSGSTLIACDQVGRLCYTMDDDPRYCDLMVRRFLYNVEGGKIQLLRNGTTMDFETISTEFRF